MGLTLWGRNWVCPVLELGESPRARSGFTLRGWGKQLAYTWHKVCGHFLKLLDERCLINLPIYFCFCCFHFCAWCVSPLHVVDMMKDKAKLAHHFFSSGDTHQNQSARLIWPWAYPRGKLWWSLLEKLYFVNSCFSRRRHPLSSQQNGGGIGVTFLFLLVTSLLHLLPKKKNDIWLVKLVGG